MKRITPAGDDKMARDFLAAALSHDTVVINRLLSLALRREIPAVDDSLTAAVSTLPRGVVDTLRQIGAHVAKADGTRTARLLYELHTPEGWGEVSVLITDEGEQRKVVGFRADRLPASLEETNAFARGARNPVRLLVLVLAAVAFGFCVWVAVLAVRSGITRRWLWAAFSLVGVGQFALDWSSGVVNINPLMFVLFSAGFERVGLVGPWIVSVAFPAGALATLHRLRRAPPTE